MAKILFLTLLVAQGLSFFGSRLWVKNAVQNGLLPLPLGELIK